MLASPPPLLAAVPLAQGQVTPLDGTLAAGLPRFSTRPQSPQHPDLFRHGHSSALMRAYCCRVYTPLVYISRRADPRVPLSDPTPRQLAMAADDAVYRGHGSLSHSSETSRHTGVGPRRPQGTVLHAKGAKMSHTVGTAAFRKKRRDLESKHLGRRTCQSSATYERGQGESVTPPPLSHVTEPGDIRGPKLP